MISPNSRIAVTDSRMAPTGFSNLSRNSGRASMQAALHSSNVHSNQWGLATKGINLLAADCCFVVPLTRSTCGSSNGVEKMCHMVSMSSMSVQSSSGSVEQCHACMLVSCCRALSLLLCYVTKFFCTFCGRNERVHALLHGKVTSGTTHPTPHAPQGP